MQQIKQQPQKQHRQQKQQIQQHRRQRSSAAITRHRHDNIIISLSLFITCLFALLPSIHCQSLSITSSSSSRQRQRQRLRSYPTSPINEKKIQSATATNTATSLDNSSPTISSKRLFKSSTASSTPSSSNDEEPPPSSSPAFSPASVKMVLILAIAAVSLTLCLLSCYPCVRKRSTGAKKSSSSVPAQPKRRSTCVDICEGGNHQDHHMEFDWVTNPDNIRGTTDEHHELQRSSSVPSSILLAAGGRRSSTRSSVTMKSSVPVGLKNNTKQQQRKQRRRRSSSEGEVSSSWKKRLSESFRPGGNSAKGTEALTAAAAAAVAQDYYDGYDIDDFEESPSHIRRPSHQSSTDEPIIKLYKESMRRYPSDRTFRWSSSGKTGSGSGRSSSRRRSNSVGCSFRDDERFEMELKKIHSNRSLRMSEDSFDVNPKIGNGRSVDNNRRVTP